MTNPSPEGSAANMDPEEISLRITLSILRALLERTERAAQQLYLEQLDGPSHDIHSSVLSALEKAKALEAQLAPSTLIKTEVHVQRTIDKPA